MRKQKPYYKTIYGGNTQKEHADLKRGMQLIVTWEEVNHGLVVDLQVTRCDQRERRHFNYEFTAKEWCVETSPPRDSDFEGRLRSVMDFLEDLLDSPRDETPMLEVLGGAEGVKLDDNKGFTAVRKRPFKYFI